MQGEEAKGLPRPVDVVELHLFAADNVWTDVDWKVSPAHEEAGHSRACWCRTGAGRELILDGQYEWKPLT